MNKNIYNVFFIGSALLLGFNSCTKKEDPTPLEAVGDVYYINKQIDNKKQTALAYFAYGNKVISSATVTEPGGDNIDLDKSKENSFTRYYEAQLTDYNSFYPVEGNYIFEIKSNEGDKLQHIDVLKKVNLKIPEISEIRYEEIDFSYDLEWKTNNKADAYFLKLFSSDKTLVFTSDLIEGSAGAYTLIPDDLGVWDAEIIIGETYTIMLSAYVYEESADASAPESSVNSQLFNIQEVSTYETSFVWDEK